MTKIEDIVSQGASQKTKSNEVKQASARQARPRRKLRIVWMAAIPLAVIIIAILSLGLFSSLSIKAVIKADKASLSEKIEVSLAQAAVDSELMVLPGQALETEVEKWSVFPATGKAVESAKANGIITVYNNHSPAKDITLIANTRFLSAQDAKVFRAIKKFVIPKAQVKNGKVEPGAITIEVIADEPGASYNIPASQFSVPGLTGTALYYNVWAESFEPMAGGSESESKKITSLDIENAKTALEASLREEAAAQLKQEAGDNLVLHPDAALDEEWEIGCFAEVGAIEKEFNCQGKGKVSFLAFDKNQAQELLLKLFADKLVSLEEMRPETLYFKAEPKTVFVNEEKMIVNLSGEIDVYEDFDQSIFLARAVGKRIEEIKQTVQANYSQITDLEFKFWPFWVKKAPKDPDKIKLEIEFE